MAVIKQVFDDGSIMLSDEAGNPLGSFDTNGQYVPVSSNVGETLAKNLLGTAVNRVLDKIMGNDTVTVSSAGMGKTTTGGTAGASFNSSIVGMIALGLGAAVLLSLVLNPRK